MPENKNKKAQIGETTTWIISTVILVVILIIFILISVTLSKTKSINANYNLEESVDWIDSKTEIAYSINSLNKNKINLWISKEEKDNENERS